MTISTRRKIITPLLTISGFITIISGLMIYFHLWSPLIRQLHIYGSLLFSALCLMHLLVNKQAWAKIIGGRKAGWAIWLVIAALSLAMLFSAFDFKAKRNQAKGGHAAAIVAAPRE